MRWRMAVTGSRKNRKDITMNTIKFGNKIIRIKEEWKVGVLATWILGLLAHAYRFFNFLPNWDSMYNFKGVGQTNNLGRIFLGFFGKLSSDYDMPWLNGALSLFYISITVILLIELFELRGRLSSILLAGLIVSFPTVTSSFAYMFTADPYMAALLMAVLSVYLAKKYKYGIFPAIVVLGLCIGTYQAYLAVAFVVILLVVIQDLLLENKSFKEMFFSDWKFFPLVVGGFVFYKIAMKIIFTYYEVVYGFDMSLLGYQGVGTEGIMTLAQYKEGFRKTMVNWAQLWCIKRDVFSLNKYGMIHIVLLAGIVLGTVLLIIKNKTYKKSVAGVVVTVLAILAMPIAAFAINFVSPEVGYHTLMEMGICFIYVLLLIYIERGQWKNRAEKVLKAVGILVLVGICYLNTVNANFAYYQMNLSYEKSYSICSDVLDRIEDLDEYPETTTRVAILGSTHAKSGDIEDLAPAIMGIGQDTYLRDEYHYISMWNHCFGRNFGMTDSGEKEAIKETEEYQDMPTYPSKGCVEVINNIIVIKLSE